MEPKKDTPKLEKSFILERVMPPEMLSLLRRATTIKRTLQKVMAEMRLLQANSAFTQDFQRHAALYREKVMEAIDLSEDMRKAKGDLLKMAPWGPEFMATYIDACDKWERDNEKKKEKRRAGTSFCCFSFMKFWRRR